MVRPPCSGRGLRRVQIAGRSLLSRSFCKRLVCRVLRIGRKRRFVQGGLTNPFIPPNLCGRMWRLKRSSSPSPASHNLSSLSMFHRLRSLTIPAGLTDILELDPGLAGRVRTLADTLGRWIGENNLVFFPEYTDHSLAHVQSVLDTAWFLVQPKSYRHLTPADAAVLTISALLHDSAMHFSVDNFTALVKCPPRQNPTDFDNKSWPELWREYISELLHLDASRREWLTGSSEPIRPPILSHDSLTDRDKKVVGEFIRRYHARLSHEIAIGGIPAPWGEQLIFADFDRQYADIAGLIARSHGLTLRSCLPYLVSRYHIRSYRGVHAPFLMVLLRIADYLQLEKTRAHPETLRVRSITSPASRLEWAAHAVIEDLHPWGDDPEAIEVIANPTDLKVFLKIKDWLRGIQEELDTSWAVLGEVYGRFEGLNELGIILRRVRSNLDDDRVFGRSAAFYPVAAKFSVSDLSLIDKLVKPLYGELPEAGLRELVQNAIDAVRERRVVESSAASPKIGELHHRHNVSADVVLEIVKNESGQWFAIVSDSGIGMTLDTVRNYFLTAGATYRESAIWNQLFTSDVGKAKVLRSGRFGIGVLAAFLLGDELEVLTRHVSASAEEGIAFSASLFTNPIELRKAILPVGTTIRIPISEETARRFDPKGFTNLDGDPWDWYCLAEPKVSRKFAGQDRPQQYTLPMSGKPLPDGWHRISHRDFEDVHWTYLKRHPWLVCNGIVVSREFQRLNLLSSGSSFLSLVMPSISVFDPDARLPLRLDRFALRTEQLPFEKEILNSVIDELVLHTMQNAPQSMNSFVSSYHGLKWKDNTHMSVYPWVNLKAGTTLLDNWILSESNVRSIRLSPRSSYYSLGSLVTNETVTPDAVIAYGLKVGVHGPVADSYFARIMYPNLEGSLVGYRVLTTKHDIEKFLASDFARLGLPVRSEQLGNGWVLLTVGVVPTPQLYHYGRFAAPMPDAGAWIPTEWYIDPQKIVKSREPIAVEWRARLGCSIIPYSSD